MNEKKKKNLSNMHNHIQMICHYFVSVLTVSVVQIFLKK